MNHEDLLRLRTGAKDGQRVEQRRKQKMRNQIRQDQNHFFGASAVITRL